MFMEIRKSNPVTNFILLSLVLNVLASTPKIVAALHVIIMYGCMCMQIAATPVTISIPQLQLLTLQWLKVEEINTQEGNQLEGEGWSSFEVTLKPQVLCCLAISIGWGMHRFGNYFFGSNTEEELKDTNPSIPVQSNMEKSHFIQMIYAPSLAIDAFLRRIAKNVQNLFVNRNRCLVTHLTSKSSHAAVANLHQWLKTNVPVTDETMHIWPHEKNNNRNNDGDELTDANTTMIEEDDEVMKIFRESFASHHFDIVPIPGMSEIYVTATGKKYEGSKSIQESKKKSPTSDNIFYTPHVDGPYWFLPFTSCYRILVGLTHNSMVRTRFPLNCDPLDQVIDTHDVVGFDYNREQHWIDHAPNQVNEERRSLLKLHYIIYPKGWHRYGAYCASLSQKFNAASRSNFISVLRPTSSYGKCKVRLMCMRTNAMALWEQNIGWTNSARIPMMYMCCSERFFLVITSFSHYLIMMCTLASAGRTGTTNGTGIQIAHCQFIRDCILFKTISLIHLANYILPNVYEELQLQRDAVVIVLVITACALSLHASVRLGRARLYFGRELGYIEVKDESAGSKQRMEYISPYFIISLGQICALGVTSWWGIEHHLSPECMYLLAAHSGCLVIVWMHQIASGVSSMYIFKT